MQESIPHVGLIDSALWLVRAVARHLRIVLSITILATTAAIIITGRMDKEYDAIAVISPPSSTSVPSLSNIASQLSGMDVSEILSGGSFSMAGNEESLLKALLASKPLHDALIDSFQLARVYELGLDSTRPFFYADLLKKFRGNLLIDETEEGFISITFRDKDYKRAMELVNCLLVKLDSIYFDYKRSEISYSRTFTTQQLLKSRARLDSLELAIIAFQKKSGIIDPESQMTSSLKVLAEVETQREMAKMQMELERGIHGENTPLYNNLKQQYAAYQGSTERLLNGKGQTSMIGLRNAPKDLIDYQKLKREYLVQSSIDNFLRQSNEQLILQDAGNISKFHVIESPWLNDKKAYPPRVAYILTIMLLSGFAAVLLSALIEFYKQEKQSDSVAYKLANDILTEIHLRKK